MAKWVFPCCRFGNTETAQGFTRKTGMCKITGCVSEAVYQTVSETPKPPMILHVKLECVKSQAVFPKRFIKSKRAPRGKRKKQEAES